MYGLLSCISLPVIHRSALETLNKHQYQPPRVLVWRDHMFLTTRLVGRHLNKGLLSSIVVA